jgi:hypothetical protein
MDYKLIVFVPKSHLDKVRKAISKAGAGKIGNYDYCTFVSEGIGTYRPLKGARPYKGKVNKIETVKEYRLEAVVPKKLLKKVIAAMKSAHPYEEPAYDVFSLISATFRQ